MSILSRRAPLALALLLAAAAPAGGAPGGLPAGTRVGAPIRLGDDAAAADFLRARYAATVFDLGGADAGFQAALLDDPGDAVLARETFLAALVAGDAAALPLARRVSADPLAELALAGQDALDGRWPAATARLTVLPADGLIGAIRPLLLAWTQFGSGDVDAALAILRPAVASPGAPGIYLLAGGTIASLAGRRQTASQYFAAARAAYPRPTLRAAQMIAAFEQANGQKAAAEATLRSLVQSRPELAPALPALLRRVGEPPVRDACDGMAETYLALAATLQAQAVGAASGQKPAGPAPAVLALAVLRLALLLRPAMPAALMQLADVESGLGRDNAALATLAAIRPDDPLAPLAALRAAGLDFALRREAAAHAALAKVSADAPRDPAVAELVGQVLLQGGAPRAAADAYARAIRLRPAGSDDWLDWFEQGVALDHAQDWPAAEASLRHALTLAPHAPEVLNYLGYSWVEKGIHLAAAHAMLQEAASLRPHDPAILDSLAWAVFRRGDVAGAWRLQQQAMALDRTDPELTYHAGVMLWSLGHKDEARGMWQRALLLDPVADDVVRITAALRGAPEQPVRPAP